MMAVNSTRLANCPVAAVVAVFFLQAEDGIRDKLVTGVQTCALPISSCAQPSPWAFSAATGTRTIRVSAAGGSARRGGSEMDIRRVGAALGGLYFIWGSTFVAVMVGIRSVPPFALTSLRYGLAGALVLLWARRKEGPLRVSARGLLDAAIAGFGMLVVGTGTIAWAEQRISSGLAALLVATVPLWTVVLDRLVNGVRVRVLTWD